MVDIPLTIFVSGIGALLVAIGLIIGFFYYLTSPVWVMTQYKYR